MANLYYLCSKDVGDDAYYMGILKRLSKSEYEFRYAINRDKAPEWFMVIPGMEDLKKVYGTDEVKDKIIHRVTPRDGTWLASVMMKQNGVESYNEWDLLESQMVVHERLNTEKYPMSDSHQIFYFYTYVPSNAHRYDD